MKAFSFYLFATINWIVTLLPLGILYMFSPLFFFVLYRFPGYRKKIVLMNLHNSFPEKSEEEIQKICKAFYKHMANLFIEVLKLQHMRPSEIKRRYKILNPEILDKLAREGKSAVAVSGHYANWEWVVSLPLSIEYKCLTVYKPLSNKYFDNFFNKFRTQYGLELVPMISTGRTLFKYEKQGVTTITGLVSDQTPPNGEIQYWTKFLNQDTPVYLGIEKLSHKFNMVVLFFRVNRVKRGYYEVNVEVITENPAELAPYEVTEKHVKLLEDQIIKNPEYWMWSHRRWKHKKPVGK